MFQPSIISIYSR